VDGNPQDTPEGRRDKDEMEMKMKIIKREGPHLLSCLLESRSSHDVKMRCRKEMKMKRKNEPRQKENDVLLGCSLTWNSWRLLHYHYQSLLGCFNSYPTYIISEGI